MRRLLSTLLLLAASAVAQVGVSGGVNHPPSGLSGNATQIQGRAVDGPTAPGQIPFYNGTRIGWFADPVVRMHRDCGIVGTGDETAALNTCIAKLPDYSGVLQCDKPGMIIYSHGVVVRDKVGIRIETAGGGPTLNNYCQLIYTGAAGGTVIDVERTRDSVIFKGFKVYAGAADIGFQTGQTGSGSNIATSDSFEEIQLLNDTGRSTFIGFMIGDRTANNSDEMKFNHVSVTSQGCTKCGTAFKSVSTNVYGTEFRAIALSNMAVGFDWTNNASVDKVNATSVAVLYRLQGSHRTFHVQHEDVEWADKILEVPPGGGNPMFVEENGRVILNTPPGLGGLGVTGTPGHPAWDNSLGGSLKVRNMDANGYGRGLTLLRGNSQGWADVDFYDPGIITYGLGNGGAGNNALNFLLNTEFLSGSAGSDSTLWVGRGFLDEKGMVVPGIGMQQTNYGVGLRGDFSPCTRGNICFNEGQVELTGVHSIFNNPTISYTGTPGSTTRNYAVVACDDTRCAAGHRSIPTTSVRVKNTLAALDPSNHVTLTWTPALGVNTYGILQQGSDPNTWNLLMSDISCATNPCAVKITTDSSAYTYAYPTYNETGGAILRGAIKFGKSATQPAAVDFTYASQIVAPPSLVTGWNADLLGGVHMGSIRAGKAVCFKDATHLGYCSTVVASDGSCTCN
jgi:hypothetical protein